MKWDMVGWVFQCCGWWELWWYAIVVTFMIFFFGDRWCKSHDRYEDDDWLKNCTMSTRSGTYVSFENNVRNMDLIAWLCSQQLKCLSSWSKLSSIRFSWMNMRAIFATMRPMVFCLPSSSGYIFRLLPQPFSSSNMVISRIFAKMSCCFTSQVTSFPWFSHLGNVEMPLLTDQEDWMIAIIATFHPRSPPLLHKLRQDKTWNHGSSYFWHMQF